MKHATKKFRQPTVSLHHAAALRAQGRLSEAAQICEAVLAGDPRNVDALHLSGILKHQQGDAVEALRLVAAVLQARPSATDVLVNHGLILAALKRHQDALASFDRVLALGRGDAALHHHRGNALKHLGRYADALVSFERALKLKPSLAAAQYNRGHMLAALDRDEEALASYDRAFALASDRADGSVSLDAVERMLDADPASLAALNNRGAVLIRLRRFADAVENYDKVLARCPDYVEALSNRGSALTELGRYADALADFARALAIQPDFAHAHYNRGNAWLGLNRIDDALACYAEALALEPDNADAHFNDALARLSIGDFRAGWRKYRYRWEKTRNAVPRQVFPQPMWRGDVDLHGKVVLLCGEQGMGDVIQFARYAPLVAGLGARVLLRVHPALTLLTTTVPGVSQVIADNEPLPPFDLYCPLMGLPEAFGTELSTIPTQVPYLRPHEDRIAKWRARVPQNGRLRIGVCWAGTPGHANDRNRSMPLERFATLLAVPGFDFVSLQKDVSARQAATLTTLGVTQLGPDFADYADTAAVISMLDLVISVDTSVAHLAGAMAKAVGLLVPFAPEFRWMQERTDSPWYPTMRLFRQTALGDWDGPLGRLRDELSGLRPQPASSAA